VQRRSSDGDKGDDFEQGAIPLIEIPCGALARDDSRIAIRWARVTLILQAAPGGAGGARGCGIITLE